MRTESNIVPERFVVESESVLFSDNVEEFDREGETFYSYDQYRLHTPIREGLAEDIESNYEAWLALAKETEARELANAEITILKKALSDTDYKAIKHSEGLISDAEYAPIKEERERYRERIRELEG